LETAIKALTAQIMHGTTRLVIIHMLLFLQPAIREANAAGITGSLNSGVIQNDTMVYPKLSPGKTEAEREYILHPGEKLEDKVRKNLFVKAVLNKSTCYIGEPVLVAFKLYSRLNSRSSISRQPSLEGFSVFDMVDIISMKETVENVEGKAFKVYIMRKSQVIPLQSGTLEIDGMEVQNKVRFIRQKALSAGERGLNDLYDKIIEEEEAPAIEKTIQIMSPPAILQVKPIPEDSPAGFNGAVGRFSLHAAVFTPGIKAQEAGVLKIEIKGSGNLTMIEPPEVHWPENIDSFGLRSREEINETVFPLQGTKTFEYTFMPAKPGEYIIPAIHFCYFDPVSGSFKTVHSAPDTFRVEAGKLSQVTSSPASRARKSDSSGSLFTHLLKPVYWITFSLMAILLILFFRYRSRQNATDKRASEAAAVPLTEIPLPDPLLKARELLGEKAFGQFYGEINKVLWNKLALQLHIPLTELNKQAIVPSLRSKGWNEEMTGRLISVLTECERNAYISGYRQESEAEAILAKASALMEVLSETNEKPEA
jgi:hypothetical protein